MGSTYRGVDYSRLVRHTPRMARLANRPEPPQEWPKAKYLKEFMRGGCGTFGLALHHISGWPLLVMYCDPEDCRPVDDERLQFGHVVLQSPHGLLVDAQGHRHYETVASGFRAKVLPPEPIEATDLLGELRDGRRIGPYGVTTWDRAVGVIFTHWGFYGFPWPFEVDASRPPSATKYRNLLLEYDL